MTSTSRGDVDMGGGSGGGQGPEGAGGGRRDLWPERLLQDVSARTFFDRTHVGSGNTAGFTNQTDALLQSSGLEQERARKAGVEKRKQLAEFYTKYESLLQEQLLVDPQDVKREFLAQTEGDKQKKAEGGAEDAGGEGAGAAPSGLEGLDLDPLDGFNRWSDQLPRWVEQQKNQAGGVLNTVRRHLDGRYEASRVSSANGVALAEKVLRGDSRAQGYGRKEAATRAAQRVRRMEQTLKVQERLIRVASRRAYKEAQEPPAGTAAPTARFASGQKGSIGS